MKKLPFPILLIICAIAGWLYYTYKPLPKIEDIKSHPEKFAFKDYAKDPVRLQTRLSTLFPVGTTAQEIVDFFTNADIARGQSKVEECYSFSIVYPANAQPSVKFMFDHKSRGLETIYVYKDGLLWPSPIKQACKKKSPAAAEKEQNGSAYDQAPVKLKLQSLDIQ